MKTLTCMIVDDEPLAVKMLEDFVSRTPYLRLAASFNDPVLAEPLPHGAPRYEGDLHDRL